KWAEKDVALRPNFATQDALAWALYRAGRFEAARKISREALSSGVKDAHLCFHAAMIHLAAGKTDEGKRLLKKGVELNTGQENFHAHRAAVEGDSQPPLHLSGPDAAHLRGAPCGTGRGRGRLFSRAR